MNHKPNQYYTRFNIQIQKQNILYLFEKMSNIYGIDIGNYKIVISINESRNNATRIVETSLSEKSTRTVITFSNTNYTIGRSAIQNV